MLTALALLVAPLAGQPALAGGILSVDAASGSVTVRFDDPVAAASTFVVAGPNRIALDVAGTRAGSGGSAGGVVAAVRQGQFDPDTARVVFELSRPAIVADAAFSTDRRALTLSLKPVDQATFGNEAARGRRSFDAPVANMSSRPSRRASVTVQIPRPAKGVALPRVQGPAGAPLVVIDAGHGGHDPGALNPDNGAREKDVTLAIARAVRDRLLKSGRVRVALTRSDDEFLVLQERYGIARRLNAALFISIHADAAENSSAHGASIYTLSEVASDREAARLAARENKADIINGVNLADQTSDVSSILIDLTQRESMNISASFARLLQREASPYMGFRQDYHKFASLMVLKAPDTPSILFETGYITNADDVVFLTSREGQRKIATGIARAVEIHFARRIASR